jgi:hypothetical protein
VARNVEQVSGKLKLSLREQLAHRCAMEISVHLALGIATLVLKELRTVPKRTRQVSVPKLRAGEVRVTGTDARP